MNDAQKLRYVSWTLAGVVLLLAAGVWAMQRLDGKPLTAYDMFPLLGLAAFGLMWTHYVLGSLRRYLHLSSGVNRQYFAITGGAVLFLILLHPGILIAQLYRDGLGLPPQSYLQTYPADKFALALGSTSLVVILLFELKRRFRDKQWWRYIEWAQIVAMVAIFFHGLSLGQELSVGWFRAVWYVYGLSLLAAIAYNTRYDRQRVKGGGAHAKQ